MSASVSLIEAVRSGAGLGVLPRDLADGLNTSDAGGTLPTREAWLLRHRDAVGNPALDVVAEAIAARASQGL